MKTLTTLPTIPEGWSWVQGRNGCWDPLDPEKIAELTTLGAHFGLTIAVGTPPAGATVWDQQTVDEVLYQPEGA